MSNSLEAHLFGRDENHQSSIINQSFNQMKLIISTGVIALLPFLALYTLIYFSMHRVQSFVALQISSISVRTLESNSVSIE